MLARWLDDSDSYLQSLGRIPCIEGNPPIRCGCVLRGKRINVAYMSSVKTHRTMVPGEFYQALWNAMSITS